MKSFITIAAILFGLLLSVQSCLTCTKCTRNDLEAKCIKPNDTLIFDQDITRNAQIHRYYSGGDSIFYYGPQGFDKSVQAFTDSGYVCSVYPTGNISGVKLCNQAGEKDDPEYREIRIYEMWEYTCYEYKGN